MEFVNNHDIKFKHQYGFQKGKLTEHAIMDLYSTIIRSIEKNEKAASILLGFAKVFNTANNEILIHKLDFYWVRSLVLYWFKSYLSNRQLAGIYM